MLTLIRKLSSLACDFRTIQNISAAINSLPAEILGYIFELVTTPWRLLGHSLAPGTNYHTLPPQSLTGVCRHWRDVALRTPPVWSFICLNRSITPSASDYSRLCLQRSRLSPLTVHLNDLDFMDVRSPVILETMAQVARIEDLRIECLFPDLNMLPLTYADAPLLKTLAIQFERALDESKPDNDATSFNRWQTPNVENLLAQGFMGWIYKPWRNLRCLCVISPGQWELQTARLFLDLLVAVGPTLQDFMLSKSNLDNNVGEQLCGYHSEIRMPSLRRIVESQLDEVVLEMLTSRLVLGGACYQQLKTIPSSNWRTMVHRLDCISPEKLFVRGISALAVRGSSAILLGEYESTARWITATAVPLETVSELWWRPMRIYRSKFAHCDNLFRRMHNVKKLVLTESLRCPATRAALMSELHCTFPELRELYIQEHEEPFDSDLTWLSAFFRQRQIAGYIMPRLIVTLDQTKTDLVALSQRLWKEWVEQLRQEVPVEMTFMMQEGDLWDGGLYKALPDICKEPSLLQSFSSVYKSN